MPSSLCAVAHRRLDDEHRIYSYTLRNEHDNNAIQTTDIVVIGTRAMHIESITHNKNKHIDTARPRHAEEMRRHDRINERPMRVVQIKIDNFRGVKSDTLDFDGSTRSNDAQRIGTCTICDALDFVLGPERLNKFPAVEEFDFYNGEYLSEDGKTPKPFVIEVLLADLNDEVEKICHEHLQLWQPPTRDQTELAETEKCLRLCTIASFNITEQEFDANTYFCHSPNNSSNQLDQVDKSIKRLFGFHYLRTLNNEFPVLNI